MKYLISVLILFTAFQANAQITQRLRLGIGVPVVGKLMVGVQDDFNYKKQANTAGPFVRYHIPFRKFAVFPQVSAGFGTITNTSYVLDWGTGQAIAKKSKQNVTEYLAGIGAAYFIAPNIGLETLLDIDIKKKRPSLDLGLQFYLRTKAR